MSRRRAFLLGALALVVVIAAIWIARRDRSRAPQSASASRAHDEALQLRLRAIRAASISLAPALPRYQLRGRVIDSAGSPVAGAQVAIGFPPQQTRSGTNGEFSLAGLLPGRYSIEARKGALVGGPVAVQLATDRDVVLVLRRGAELRVEVVSAQDKRPIPNADVQLSLLSMYDHGGEQHARTDASGVATFEGVTLVAHTIWVGADGFAEQTDTVDPMHVAGTSLTFRVELAPGVTVRGRVVDAETGRPIAGAAIEGVAGDHRERARRGDDKARLGNAPPYAMEVRGVGVRSDAEGRFRIGVTRGAWTIVASHASYATTGGFLVVNDAPLELQLSMSKGVVIRGVVVAENDTPVPGAEVEARWQHGGRIEHTTRADGRGHFELVGLPAAPLEILARSADATSTPRRFDLAQSVPDDDVLLVLDNSGTITGRVVRGGKPVGGAQVFYVEEGARAKVHPAVVNAGDDGAFRITGIALDRNYALTAMPHQDGDAWFHSGGAQAKAGADVTIEIPADGTLRGRVVVPGGKLAGITVEIEGNTPARALERTGGFAFVGIPPGARNLLFKGAGIADRRITAELHAGENLDLGVIQLATGRVVAGKVMSAKQEPIADAEIIVQTAGTSELRASTRPDGTFSLVAPSDRELIVEARGRRGGLTHVTVAANAASSELVLTFTGTATLEGEVSTGDEPIDNALVVLRRPGVKSDRPYAYTETDSAGYFRLGALEPGAYELVITRDDAEGTPQTYARSIEIKAGSNIEDTDLAQLKPRSTP
ncbi:MAG TPA: carboxypeptidase regulatory-like domain-containing protein [Kofleriaceae bacterium]